MQLASGRSVTHFMTMPNEQVLAPEKTNSRRASGGSFRSFRARGPVIDQYGREIPEETLGEGFRRTRFDFAHSTVNPFGELTREQRLARFETLAKLLDIAFLLPGTKIRYGVDGIIRLIPIVGDLLATAFSLWLVREARALGAPGTSPRECSAMSRSMVWLEWYRSQAMPSTCCFAPICATCDCCGAGWRSSRVSVRIPKS